MASIFKKPFGKNKKSEEQTKSSVLDVRSKADDEMQAIMNGSAAQKITSSTINTLDSIIGNKDITEKQKIEEEVEKLKKRREKLLQQQEQDEQEMRDLFNSLNNQQQFASENITNEGKPTSLYGFQSASDIDKALELIKAVKPLPPKSNNEKNTTTSNYGFKHETKNTENDEYKINENMSLREAEEKLRKYGLK